MNQVAGVCECTASQHVSHSVSSQCIVIVLACFAIHAYINMAGQQWPGHVYGTGSNMHMERAACSLLLSARRVGLQPMHPNRIVPSLIYIIHVCMCYV